MTWKCTNWCHNGDNLDRYLLGRQFMVVIVVFTVNISGAPLGGAELWGLPQWIIDVFLGSGLAMILFTCMVGQLNSQVNGCHCMLDYSKCYNLQRHCKQNKNCFAHQFFPRLIP